MTAVQLVGAWDLKSCFMEDVASGEKLEPWGAKPNGRLVVTGGGYWIVVQTAEGRKVPQSDADRSTAFRSLLAYSGKCRTEGQSIVVDVDIAWDEAWTGTKQIRHFKVEKDELHVEAAPQPYPNFGDRVLRAVLIWRRAE